MTEQKASVLVTYTEDEAAVRTSYTLFVELAKLLSILLMVGIEVQEGSSKNYSHGSSRRDVVPSRVILSALSISH